MSEVKYYHISDTGLSEGVSLGRITVVLGADYDAAQSELSALREELAKVNREKNDVAYRANETAERLNLMTISKATMRNKLKQKLAATQQRLTAAEQRNAELIELLNNVSESVTGRNGTFARIPADWFDKRDDALRNQPTESVTYQSREIGESDWADCTKAEYDRCGKDPHMDTRIKTNRIGSKRMSSKIESVSIPRELLERHLLKFSMAGLMFTKVEGLLKSYDELNEILAAPVVERQPLETVAGHHPACRAVDDYKPGDCSHGCTALPELAELQAELADTNVRLSNSIEQVDELQATIDRLTAEFGRLKKAWHASVKVTTQDVMQAIEEIPGAPMLTSNHCHALAMRLNFFIDKVKELDH